MTRFDFDESGYAELLAMADNNVMDPTAHAIARDASRMAPVDTGELRDSYLKPDAVIHEEPLVWAIGSAGCEHGAVVELGGRPHMIPHAFGRPGAVHHPGTSAQPHLRPALYRERVEGE
jgi:hypothetical protein